MGFVKGTDGVAKTVRNPLEGSIGDVALSGVSVGTLSASANITTSGNSVAVGNVSGGNVTASALLRGVTVQATGNLVGGNANVSNGIFSITAGFAGNVTAGNISTGGKISATGNISGNVLFSPSTPADWANASAIYNVALALNALASLTANFESGSGFAFSGPFSNDAAANAGGVAIGQVYYNNSGGLVVRQT